MARQGNPSGAPLLYNGAVASLSMMKRHIPIIVEKHADGYVAYPVGLKGVVVAQGDTYEEALVEVRSAIEFHVETFGSDVLELEDPATEVRVAETAVAV
jgi:predicted RNase H-like HicB family nuclease